MSVKDSDDARSRLYSLCEGEIDGGALRELGLILRGHSYLLNMLKCALTASGGTRAKRG